MKISYRILLVAIIVITLLGIVWLFDNPNSQKGHDVSIVENPFFPTEYLKKEFIDAHGDLLLTHTFYGIQDNHIIMTSENHNSGYKQTNVYTITEDYIYNVYFKPSLELIDPETFTKNLEHNQLNVVYLSKVKLGDK